MEQLPAVLDSDGLLYCRCGSNNLHHVNTTIFEREEDADITTVIAQDGKTVQVSDFPSADTCNPSSRRHGMLIEFWCEICDPEAIQRLSIQQHKGCTYMRWVD